MFDIGFVELLICGVIALIVLGPERLPTAARAAGRWVGAARRMVSQFSSELDSQLKAEELREELRKAGDVGLDDVQKSVRGALDEAKKYEHMVVSDSKTIERSSSPAARRAQEPPVAEPEPPEQLDPDEDPTSANNSGHSSLDEPEPESDNTSTDQSRERSPDSRT
ncbi:Sec-independent protein translocase protein TatB [Marinobacter sp. CHS3-4]|uniref:Sec-independent protein translocase protein TatB n=1 Tax=Marinobacter sp. CHS3-4 TaxID=3045174 RepID=UPI0024B50CAF|nr:Sec-independent protein translocase protein TatB [Marinobacter sp. CHS3-4]MDI9244324.1 Sec-independent protein translocase protein TatB [Marinobacter sp. CHS3-4]